MDTALLETSTNPAYPQLIFITLLRCTLRTVLMLYYEAYFINLLGKWIGTVYEMMHAYIMLTYSVSRPALTPN